MSKTAKIIAAVIVAAFVGLIAYNLINNRAVRLGDYDFNSIISADENNGNIGDHVKGNPDAKVVIFEYMDYQCSGCASVHSHVDQLIKDYGDKIAVVQRAFAVSHQHTNAVAAASAVEAAGLQGYWAEYGAYLFEHQADWFYSDATVRTSQFSSYFDIVSDHKGDSEKFLADMSSEAVAKKVNFDAGIANRISDQISYAPAFFIDGELIDWAYKNEDQLSFVDYFHKIIDQKLSESEQN